MQVKMGGGRWLAAVSAILAPTSRNSQKGVMKLPVAAAADEEGRQQTIRPSPTPTLDV